MTRVTGVTSRVSTHLFYFSDWLCCTIQRDHPFHQTEDQGPRTGHETKRFIILLPLD